VYTNSWPALTEDDALYRVGIYAESDVMVIYIIMITLRRLHTDTFLLFVSTISLRAGKSNARGFTYALS